jgi:N-methylhydantoinase A
MRYVGQAYELEVAVAAPLTPATVSAVVDAFHAAHERVYGYARAQQPTEVVNLRAVHTYPLPRPALRATAPAGGTLADARRTVRRAYFLPDGFVETAIYDRARLPAGARVPGPAILEQIDTTTVIPPGYVADVEVSGNVKIRRAAGAGARG